MQANRAHAENPGRLDRDRSEHGLRFGALRDQRRDPPQRALLLGQATQLLARLLARDRTGHQLAEVGEPRRRPGGERFGGGRNGDQGAPRRLANDDRDTDGAIGPGRPSDLRNRLVQLRRIIDACYLNLR